MLTLALAVPALLGFCQDPGSPEASRAVDPQSLHALIIGIQKYPERVADEFPSLHGARCCTPRR